MVVGGYRMSGPTLATQQAVSMLRRFAQWHEFQEHMLPEDRLRVACAALHICPRGLHAMLSRHAPELKYKFRTRPGRPPRWVRARRDLPKGS